MPVHRAALVFAALIIPICATPSYPQQTQVGGPRWYVYLDAASKENHGYWTNYMPEAGAQMIGLNMVDPSSPASGTTAIRVSLKFADPQWCGVAVSSSPDYWGQVAGPGFDLTGAKRLVFHARGELGGEFIQAKLGIAGDKAFGDSLRLPAATKWIRLSRDWQEYSIPLKGLNLKRIITPFAFVSDRAHNPGGSLNFYLADIYVEMSEPPSQR